MEKKESGFSTLVDSVLDRVTEIIWWNRQLTKLDDIQHVSNYEDFIKKDLVEVKGPFVEYVRPPMTSNRSMRELLESMDYNNVAIDSFIRTLFNGDDSLPLYWHQEEAIMKIHDGDSPVVVSVPTATGKTECFLLPILNYCIESNEKGVKAIIIYPTKTLEVDQLNRFIRYMDTINENPKTLKQLTIGIWDGDTPYTVGYDVESNQIPVNSYVRGIECPKCREKLRINDRGQLHCENDKRTFPWIRVIRQKIKRKGIDILVTNPEALDFLLINPDLETQQILGEVPGKAPMKFIVFDEAHIWTGVTGSGIHLLIRRLLNFFKARKPRLILLSATISNPETLGKELTGENKVEVVRFKTKKIDAPTKVDFKRIKPCRLPNILQTLAYIVKKTSDAKDLEEGISDFENTIYMLKLLGLVVGDSKLLPTEEGKSLLNSIDISSGEEIENQDLLVERFLDSDRFQEKWQEIILEHLPEVQRLAGFFPDDPNKPSFAPLKTLIRKISFESGLDNDTSEEILLTCLNLGRAANLLTDKHHIFLRPPSEMFLCESCKLLMTRDICPQCKQVSKQIRVCQACHFPYVADEPGKIKKESGSGIFVPLYSVKQENDGRCPNCFSKRRLVDPNVPYSTMVTFLASAVCRLLPSHKVLLFSDSRRTAEKMGADIIDNDYSLVAQQIIVRLLLDNKRSMSSKNLYFEVLDELKRRYYLYLHDELDQNDEVSQLLINELLEQHIKKLAFLVTNKRLFDQSIVTAQAILEFNEPLDVLLAHEILKLLMSRRSFQKHKKKIYGLTPERMEESLTKKYPNLIVPDLEKRISQILKKLTEKDVIQNRSLKETLTDIDSMDTDETTILLIKEYLEEELQKLNDNLKNQHLAEVQGPLFQRHLVPDYVISLVDEIFYCQTCYSVFPAKRSGIFQCPKCGERLDYVSRWRGKNNGRLPTSKINYMIDHWGNDISRVAATHPLEEIPHISVGVNRAGIPSSLRGIIEEGFRKSDPRINAISATPVMELGIDIGSLDVVCQIGIPPTVSNYVQRSGRAGRIRGRPSLILTVIRGDHPVDSYYFDRIERFLSSSDKLSVPSPLTFPTILGSHVATEVLSYLARNPDPLGIYSKVFTIKSFSGQAIEFADLVIDRIKALAQLVREIKTKELEIHLEPIFEKEGMATFRQIFIEEGDGSMVKKAEEIYGNLSKTGNVAISSEESQRQLGNWMSRLGFLANYRGMNDQLPLILERKKGSGKVEFKSYDYAIRESFPGPENKDGAMFYVEANKFIVKSVYGLDKKLLQAKTCQNYEMCDFPFKIYTTDFEVCPFCDHELKSIQVYQIGPIKTRPARRLGDNFTTYGIESQFIEFQEVVEKSKHTFFRMPTNILFGKARVVSFTPAFEKRYYWGSPRLLLSQAKIEQTSSSTENLTPIERILKEQEVPYYPVGFAMGTYGFSIEIEKETMEKRLGEEKNWLDPVSLISLIQALKKAICIVTKCELQDFDVDFSVNKESLSINVIDAREGGNNISMMVWEDFVGGKKILKQIRDIANCRYCSKFCDRCLLIRRTPSYILEKDLLNREDLKRLLSI